MRAARLFVLGLLLSGVGCATFTRPEGDGGWSAERRTTELGRLAIRAGVDFGAPPPDAAAADAPRSIDLPTALSMAAKGNRTIASAARRLDIEAERVRSARGGLLPNATASGRYSWFTDPQANRLRRLGETGAAPAANGGFPSAIEIRESELSTVNGTLQQTIDFGFGRGGHALAAARAGYRGEQARAWATTLDQQLAVTRAYFQCLEARRLAEVTDQNVALYRAQLGNAEAKFQSGRLTKNELLVVQVALNGAEQDKEQRALAIARARWTLNQAIGADVNAQTEIADVAERPLVPAVEEALRIAFAENPALRSLVEEQQRLEETERSRALQRIPTFYWGAAIDYSTSDILQPRDVGSGFVGFTWDLGTDLRREAEIAEARIASDRNRTEIERQLRELEALVRSAQQAAAERLSATTSAETSVGQAEENLRIRRQQFDAGRASSEDVLDAQAILSAERASRASALYQAHVRLAELRSMMGRNAAPEATR